MARKKLSENNIRKLVRTTRGSLLVSIPIEFARDLKWKGKQKVVINKRGKRLIIEDWKE